MSVVTPETGPADAHSRGGLGAVVRSNDLDRWSRDLVNDFQAPIEAAHPAIREARLPLAEAGAGYTSLSGSGSAVFGVFETEGAARLAEEGLSETCRVWTEGPRGSA